MKNIFVLILINCICLLQTIPRCATQSVCLKNTNICIECVNIRTNGNCVVSTESICNDNSVVCENDGVCITGVCYCVNGHYGSNCQLSASSTNSTTTTSTAVPTGILGLNIGYPLYLTLVIPSVAVSACIVCHLCVLCCIPAMLCCRRCGKRKSKTDRKAFRSSRMIENRSDLDLHAVTNLENRHISVLHDYTEMTIPNRIEPSSVLESYQEMNNVLAGPSPPTRPLPPAPPSRSRDRPLNQQILPPISSVGESCEYSYPFVSFGNNLNRGVATTVGVANVRRSVTEERDDPEQAGVSGARGSGYTQMEPKYVIQQHEDRDSMRTNV